MMAGNNHVYRALIMYGRIAQLMFMWQHYVRLSRNYAVLKSITDAV